MNPFVAHAVRCQLTHHDGKGGEAPTHNVRPILKNMRRVPKKVNRLLGRDFFPILFEEQVSSATLAPGVFRDQSWGVCGGTEPSGNPSTAGALVGMWVWDELVRLKEEDYPYGLKTQRETCDWPLAIGSLEEK